MDLLLERPAIGSTAPLRQWSLPVSNRHHLNPPPHLGKHTEEKVLSSFNKVRWPGAHHTALSCLCRCSCLSSHTRWRPFVVPAHFFPELLSSQYVFHPQPCCRRDFILLLVSFYSTSHHRLYKETKCRTSHFVKLPRSMYCTRRQLVGRIRRCQWQPGWHQRSSSDLFRFCGLVGSWRV